MLKPENDLKRWTLLGCHLTMPPRLTPEAEEENNVREI